MSSPKVAEFVIDRDYTFFTPLDITSTILGFGVLLILNYLRRRRNKELPYYSYYTPAFLFKLFFVLANCIFYISVYGAGGDSIGYWDGAIKLNHLFWKDPIAYFEEIWRNDTMRSIYKNFDYTTGYPDNAIYKEAPSFFISKIASFFSFFTFKGYLLMSLIFAFLTTTATWRLLELLRDYKLHSDWHLALALFFIPSLSFWCGGISKDTVMWISVCYFLYNLYIILSLEKKSSWLNWLGILICLYVMLQVRTFMIITVLAPLFFAYNVRIGKKYGSKSFESRFLKITFSLIGLGLIIVFFQSSLADEFLKEASVINQDMSTNKTYGTNRYSLGVIDYTPLGMFLAFPSSILAGIYRPYIWESLSVSLILNGIESIVLMYFTFKFFIHRNILERIQRIRKNEFLIYALFFSLILAYFSGFTSILFGVLVRFKAPVLPFIVLILTAHYKAETDKSSVKNFKQYG